MQDDKVWSKEFRLPVGTAGGQRLERHILEKRLLKTLDLEES
jgi:hypothetical protein